MGKGGKGGKSFTFTVKFCAFDLDDDGEVTNSTHIVANLNRKTSSSLLLFFSRSLVLSFSSSKCKSKKKKESAKDEES